MPVFTQQSTCEFWRRQACMVPLPAFQIMTPLWRATCCPCAACPCRYQQMKEAYEYDGLDTCAADGMCQEKCPVKVSAGTSVVVDAIVAALGSAAFHEPIAGTAAGPCGAALLVDDSITPASSLQ